MFKKNLALLLAALMVCSLAACGKSSSQVEGTQPTDNTSVQEQTETADTENTSEAAETASAICLREHNQRRVPEGCGYKSAIWAKG